MTPELRVTSEGNAQAPSDSSAAESNAVMVRKRLHAFVGTSFVPAYPRACQAGAPRGLRTVRSTKRLGGLGRKF